DSAPAVTPLMPRASAALPVSERWHELRTLSRGDPIYRVVLGLLASLLPLLLLIILGELIVGAWPAIRTFGPGFLFNSTWDPVSGRSGAVPLIFGTLYSSLVPVVIAVPPALGVALFPPGFAP